MVNGFEGLQKAGQEGFSRALQSLSALSTGWQELAAQAAGFSKQSLEEGTAHVEKLLAAKSIDVAMGAQADFVKTQYEKAAAQATRFGEIYLGVVRDAVKPFEGFVPASTK